MKPVEYLVTAMPYGWLVQNPKTFEIITQCFTKEQLTNILVVEND